MDPNRPMTAHANSLTGGVMTLAASDFRVLINGLQQLGYDTRAILDKAGLHDIDPDDPDGRIPCESYGTIVTIAQQQRFTPNLGLAVAKTVPVGAYPLLDYLIVTSDSVGAGIRQLSRYLDMAGNPVGLVIEDDETAIVTVRTRNTSMPFSAEFMVALAILQARNETERAFSAREVFFAHQPDDVSAFADAMGCPVHTRAGWDGLRIDRAMWRLPLRRRDPMLRQVLESFLAEKIARSSKHGGVATGVQRLLSSRLAGGDPRMDDIARELAMSGRTLQRKLADEGVSFQDLLNETRKETAARLLQEPTLAIGEVAYMVGYSEPAPFHRAFKRWYGVTPEGYRRSKAPRSRF